MQPATLWAPHTSQRASSTNEGRVNSYTSRRPTGIPVSASPFSAHTANITPNNSGTTRKSSRPIRQANSNQAGASVQENITCRIIFIPYQVHEQFFYLLRLC